MTPRLFRLLCAILLLWALLWMAFAPSAVARVADPRAEGRQEVSGRPTVLEILEAQPELSRFWEAVRQSGVQEELMGRGPIIVFAPTNDAFDTLERALEYRLYSDPAALAVWVRRHIIADDVILTPQGVLARNGAVNPIPRFLIDPAELL